MILKLKTHKRDEKSADVGEIVGLCQREQGFAHHCKFINLIE